MGFVVTVEDGLLPWFVAMTADIIRCLLFEKLLVGTQGSDPVICKGH